MGFKDFFLNSQFPFITKNVIQITFSQTKYPYKLSISWTTIFVDVFCYENYRKEIQDLFEIYDDAISVARVNIVDNIRAGSLYQKWFGNPINAYSVVKFFFSFFFLLSIPSYQFHNNYELLLND